MKRKKRKEKREEKRKDSTLKTQETQETQEERKERKEKRKDSTLKTQEAQETQEERKERKEKREKEEREEKVMAGSSGIIGDEVLMEIKRLHSWDLEAAEARAVQARLAAEVVEETPAGFQPRMVAAADISADRFSSVLFAAVVVMSFPEMETIEVRTVVTEAVFPYVPGLLSFRELPALEKAFGELEEEPDLVLLDGHGRAHPRRLGLACHAGLLLGKPAVGVAKSVLVGKYEAPGRDRGCFSPLVDEGETVGVALRTRTGVKPVFVSIGHMIDLEAAREIVVACAAGRRLPEPSRAAHEAANRARRAF